MRLLQLCFCTLTIKVRCSTQSLDREWLLSLKFESFIFVQNSEVSYHSLSLMQQKIKPVAQRLVEYMTFLKIRKQETSWRNISVNIQQGLFTFYENIVQICSLAKLTQCLYVRWKKNVGRSIVNKREIRFRIIGTESGLQRPKSYRTTILEQSNHRDNPIKEK